MKEAYEKIKRTNNLLQLLEKGCRIEFPDELWLSGDRGGRYINVGTMFGYRGHWDISKEGMKNALEHLKSLREELKREWEG